MKRDDLESRAQKFVWRHHGRGLSTAVGIQTRTLIRDAFSAGFRSAQRFSRRRAPK